MNDTEVGRTYSKMFEFAVLVHFIKECLSLPSHLESKV